VAGVLALSYYYKNQINTMKQAPFSVPSWAPTMLFPKDYSFYYEYEISVRDKTEANNFDDNNIEHYLK